MKTKKKASKAKNPRKCRTFQAKRKVGKRVIKVTRKICKNPKPRHPELGRSSNAEFELYLSNSPYFQFLYEKYGNDIPINQARLYAHNHHLELEDLGYKAIHGSIDTLDFVKQLGY